MKQLKFKLNNGNLTVWYIQGPRNGPVLHWAHANGFNAATYQNLLKKLALFCSVYAWDARSHGQSYEMRPVSTQRVYDQYVCDFQKLIEFLYHKHSTPIIAAGHSFGASLCIKAASQLDKKISKLILADPVLFTPLAAKISKTLRFLKFKYPRSIYLARNAAKRTNYWISREAAFSTLSQKSVFKKWDRISLENYISYGTVKNCFGIQLACPREVEASIFQESENEFLSKRIANLTVNTHAYFAAKGSPSFARNSFKKSTKIKTLKTLPSTNHLFPIERYQEFSEEIKHHITS